MSFTFKPAKREGVHLIVGLMGGTGSGKTCSALELATGLAGGKPFAVIDTEAGRSQHYADEFAFDHGDLCPPFTPDAYLEAIVAAEKKGYPVVVVDSMSHEHAGEGGILDMHEEELGRIAGNDWKKREKATYLAWVKPKMSHKRMVGRLLQLRTHLILCFRAEPKMKIIKVEKNGRVVNEPVDAGWQPVCAKGLEFEMTASWMLRHERPGQVFAGEVDEADPIGSAIKLPKAWIPFFGGAQLLSRKHGETLREWAAGSAAVDFGAMIREEYVRPGKLTSAGANAALVEAGIKEASEPIPPTTDVAKVRAVLLKAATSRSKAQDTDPEPEPEPEAETNGSGECPWADLEEAVSAAGVGDEIANEWGPPGPQWELNRKAVKASIQKAVRS